MKPAIALNLDPANPGHFFACCGLLEIAHRLTGHAEGWFDEREFFVAAEINLPAIIKAVVNLEAKALDPEDDKAPPLQVCLASQVFRLDWWQDTFAGGSTFKTWAGQQRIEVILANMLAGLKAVQASLKDPADLLHAISDERAVPFYFNARTGSHSSSIDVGYSLDALSGNNATRQVTVSSPGTEVFALFGLQRFRPHREPDGFYYATWHLPSPPLLAAALQHLPTTATTRYAFKLLYRTKYLKSFLTAQIKA